MGRLRGNSGYSLVEFLIVIGLISIFSLGIMLVLYNTYKAERIGRGYLKSEGDRQALLSQLRRIFVTVGFGVPIDYFKVSSICGENFVISGNNTNPCFLSLALRQTNWSGCWWICQRTFSGNGTFMTRARTRLGTECPLDPMELPNNQKNFLVIEGFSKKLLSSSTEEVTCGNEDFGKVIIYLGRNYLFPQDFLVQVYLHNGTTSKFCAPTTKNLELQIGDDVPQPLISCVADFRIKFIDYNGNYHDNLTAFGNRIYELKGLRICLVVQIGGRLEVQEEVPGYSKCGEYLIDPSWRYYRWVVIEEDIPFYNLHNWRPSL